MSCLRQLLITATKQYASLSLNSCAGATPLLKNSFHSSSCVKVDLDGLMDAKEQKTNQNETKEPQKKTFSEIQLDPDYMPGGEYIPSRQTRYLTMDGVRFDLLPRVYVNATYQNTKMSAHDFISQKNISTHTGGSVGFKNSKKKTSVCGQTVGLAIGMDLVKKGFKNVIVVVKGQGNGRLPAIKGIQLAGVNIVAITDKTYPPMTTRPRKARRL